MSQQSKNRAKTPKQSGPPARSRIKANRSGPHLLCESSAARRGQPPAAHRHGVHQRQQQRQEQRRPGRSGSRGARLQADRYTGHRGYLRAQGLDVEIVYKINEGRPHIGDEILNKRVQLVINTPLGRESFFDDRTVRRIAMLNSVPAITTLTGAAATVSAIAAMRAEGLTVKSLQEYHQK